MVYHTGSQCPGPALGWCFFRFIGNTVQQSGASFYSVAYGDDADLKTMQSIAFATNGVYYQGDESTISDIYAEMSAAFGGSLGIGR